MNKRESSESGDHHLVFASDIKALPPLYFDPSVGGKRGRFFWMQFKLHQPHIPP